MPAQADAGEGLGPSQGGKRRQRKEEGLKRGSTGFIQSLFSPVPILRTFHYWGKPVPYLKLFWVKPVKKHPVYYMFDRRTDGRVQFGGILILLPHPLACRPSLSVQSPNEQKPAELSVNL